MQELEKQVQGPEEQMLETAGQMQVPGIDTPNGTEKLGPCWIDAQVPEESAGQMQGPEINMLHGTE